MLVYLGVLQDAHTIQIKIHKQTIARSIQKSIIIAIGDGSAGAGGHVPPQTLRLALGHVCIFERARERLTPTRSQEKQPASDRS